MNNIIIKVYNQKQKIELNNDIENCLTVLYQLEDLFNYEISEISDCINLLQNITVKKVIYDYENKGV